MTTDDPIPDQSRQVATDRDSLYSLSIDEAAALYARAGHPRTPRSIQRYCASGHLDAVKEATSLGDKYFIDPASVARHIAQIEELIALDSRSTGRDGSRPVAVQIEPRFPDDSPRPAPTTDMVMSPPVAPNRDSHFPKEPASNGRQIATEDAPPSRPVATGVSDTSRYVAGLERELERALEDRTFMREQITTKDQQIAALLERDRETNILVRGLQEMLTPLLGGPRRHTPPNAEPHVS